MMPTDCIIRIKSYESQNWPQATESAGTHLLLLRLIKAIVYTAKRAKYVKFGRQDQIWVPVWFVIFDVFSFTYNIIRMSIADE